MNQYDRNSYVLELQSTCDMVADGQLSQEEEQAFLDEVKGAFGDHPVYGRSVSSAVMQRNFHALRGALGKFYTLSSGSGRIEVNQHNDQSVSSTAVASTYIEASFTNTMSQMWALPDDVLTTDQKQELARLLQAVEDSGKDEGKLRKAGKAVVDWAFDNAMKAIPTVMPYVTQAVQGMMG